LDFSLVLVGFLLSPLPYAQAFLRKPSFLVLVDFFHWFFKSKQLLGFLGVIYMLKQGPNRNITFYLNFIKLNIANSNMSVRYSFCKQTNKVHPPSTLYITQKIRQV
jgi:hypothetical protein